MKIKIEMAVSPTGSGHSISINDMTSAEFDAVRIILMTLALNAEVLHKLPVKDLGLDVVINALSKA